MDISPGGKARKGRCTVPRLRLKKFASETRSSTNGATMVSRVPSRSPCLMPRRIGAFASRSEGHPRPNLVQRKYRKRFPRHGHSDFTSGKLGPCFAEEKSDGRRSLRRRVGQRNADFARLIGVVEGDDNTFFL